MSINQIQQINNNNSNNNISNRAEAKAEAKAIAKASAEVTVTIEDLLGETELLKEDLESELGIQGVPEEEVALVVKDVEAAEKALNDLETANQNGEAPKPAATKRLSRFLESLTKEDSRVNKAFKMLDKGKEYAYALANGYTKLATQFDLPPLEELPEKVSQLF